MATVRLRLSRGFCNAGVTKGGPAYSRHQSSGSEQPVLSIEALACYGLLCLVTVGGDGRQDTCEQFGALPGDSVSAVGNGAGYGRLGMLKTGIGSNDRELSAKCLTRF